jgi:CBS domain-containing protein
MTAVVNRDGTLAGLFTDGDLRRTLEKNIDIRSARVAQVMIRDPHTIGSDRLAAEALQYMEKFRINGLLVVSIDANEQFNSQHRCCEACCRRKVKVRNRAGQRLLAVELDVTLPQVHDLAQAVKIVAAAHQVCPYSNATRGNIDVALTANGHAVDASGIEQCPMSSRTISASRRWSRMHRRKSASDRR